MRTKWSTLSLKEASCC